MSNMNAPLARLAPDSRKKKKKNKKRSKARKASQSTTSAPQPEIPTLPPSDSSSKKIKKKNGQVDQNQPSHNGSVGEEGLQGKQPIATDSCLKSGETLADSCTCVKINGYCAHSKIQINGTWYKVTDLTPVGNNGRRLKETFPISKELVRPRLKDVIRKMKVDRNAATEEALARSRGLKAYRSWKVKRANEALAREMREEEEEDLPEGQPNKDPNISNFPSSPPSRLETPPMKDSNTTPQLPSPTAQQEDAHLRKRKHKAHREEKSTKRRKVSPVVQPTLEDAADTMEGVIRGDEKATNWPQEINLAQTSAPPIVVETNKGLGWPPKLQEGHEVSPNISPSLIDKVVLASEEKQTMDLHRGASKVKVKESEPSSMVDALDQTVDDQSVVDTIETQPKLISAEGGGIISKHSKRSLPSNDVRHDSVRREMEEVEKVGKKSLGPPKSFVPTETGKPLATKADVISLEADSSDDDVQVVSVKTCTIKPKQTKGLHLNSSPSGITPKKSRQAPKPNSIHHPPSLEKSFSSETPTTKPSQVETKENKSAANPNPPSSTENFTPALVGLLLNTKARPIAVNDDFEEELTSPESSPGFGVARIQIEVGPKEVKFVCQAPKPIAISSDSDDDTNVPRKRTLSDLRTQYRTNAPSAPHSDTTAKKTTTKHAGHQNAQPGRAKERAPKRQDVWPEETRGALAQAAIEYLNALPQNKQSQITVSEMLKILGKESEFDELCSQIRMSGRALSKPTFAMAILSKIEPAAKQGPVKHTQSSPRSDEITSTRPASNTPKKRTPRPPLDNSATKSQKPTAEISSSDGAKAAPRKPEVILLNSPEPSPPKSTFPRDSLKSSATTRNTAKTLRSDRTKAVLMSQLDLPASVPTIKPHTISKPVTQEQARKDEVLDYIAERLLLHEGLRMLPQLLEFLVEQTVKEEGDLFKAEQPVAKPKAEKAAKDVKNVKITEEFPKMRRKLDFLGSTGAGEKVEETPRKRRRRNFEWKWENSEDAESRKRTRGRSTSLAPLSEQPDQTRPGLNLQTPVLQYTQKIRGRSTTPMLWLSQSSRDEAAAAESERVASESTVSGDYFFDAKEWISSDPTGSTTFTDASEGGAVVLVGGTPVRKENYVDFSMED